MKAIQRQEDGFHSWTDAEIAAFEARTLSARTPRLALALLLYTGQRRIRRGDDGTATHRQERRDPCAPVQDRRGTEDPDASDLQAIIDATP